MTTKVTRKSSRSPKMGQLDVGDVFTYEDTLMMKIKRFSQVGGLQVNAVKLISGEFAFVQLDKAVQHHDEVEIIV